MLNIKKLYQNAKEAKIGTPCICPSCGTDFIKTNYQQAFCKAKTGTKCKDKYWNTITPSKKNNTTRISPTNARWQARNSNNSYHTHSNIVGYSQAELDRIDRENNNLNFEGGGQGGMVNVERCKHCGCLDCRCDYFVSSFD